MASAIIEINPGVSTETNHKDTSNACERSPAEKKKGYHKLECTTKKKKRKQKKKT